MSLQPPRPTDGPPPGPESDDPTGYLISEFELIILRMAQEIDSLRNRLAQLESMLPAAGAPDPTSGRVLHP